MQGIFCRSLGPNSCTSNLSCWLLLQLLLLLLLLHCYRHVLIEASLYASLSSNFLSLINCLWICHSKHALIRIHWNWCVGTIISLRRNFTGKFSWPVEPANTWTIWMEIPSNFPIVLTSIDTRALTLTSCPPANSEMDGKIIDTWKPNEKTTKMF